MTAPLLPSESAPAPRAITAADIDASCRWPVTLLLWKSLGWFAIAALLLLISSIKLHGPGFLSGAAWLTLGRVRPAAMNALLYGFACQAAFGVSMWLVCRLGRVRLEGGPAFLIAGAAWNLAVFLGVIGILAGASTGFQWLEMPAFVAPLLFVAYAALGAWMLITFARRTEGTLYVSQWYLLAALFCFPWIFSVASLLLLGLPVRGVLQAVVGAWYRSNFLELWLTPVALAATFYFIPKLVRRPLYSSGLAKFGFWALVLFAGWTGFTQMIGGPIPAWMISVSVAANGLLLLSVFCVAVNLQRTLCGKDGCAAALQNPTLRYIVFGVVCYVVAGLMGVVIGTRTVAVFTRFTYVETARTLLVVLGCFGMTMLGAIHDIIPRVLQTEWASAKLARASFLGSAVGVALIFLGLTAAGLVQGAKLNHPAVQIVTAIKATAPFMGMATLGWLLLLAGQVALLINLGKMLAARWVPVCRSALSVLRGADAPAAKAEART
jgi:cytochrome c oxidase cbb3-type subunit I